MTTRMQERGHTDLDDTALNAVLDHELDRLDRPVLSQPMNTVHSLCTEHQEERRLTGDEEHRR